MVHDVALIVRTREKVLTMVIINWFVHLGAASSFSKTFTTLINSTLPHHIVGANQCLAAAHILEIFERCSIQVLLWNAPLTFLACLAEAAEVIIHQDWSLDFLRSRYGFLTASELKAFIFILLSQGFLFFELFRLNLSGLRPELITDTWSLSQLFLRFRAFRALHALWFSCWLRGHLFWSLSTFSWDRFSVRAELALALLWAL